MPHAAISAEQAGNPLIQRSHRALLIAQAVWVITQLSDAVAAQQSLAFLWHPEEVPGPSRGGRRVNGLVLLGSRGHTPFRHTPACFYPLIPGNVGPDFITLEPGQITPDAWGAEQQGLGQRGQAELPLSKTLATPPPSLPTALESTGWTTDITF